MTFLQIILFLYMFITNSNGPVQSHFFLLFDAMLLLCLLQFEIHPVEVDKARPNRPCNSLPSEKPPPVQKPPPQAVKHGEPAEDVPCTSA